MFRRFLFDPQGGDGGSQGGQADDKGNNKGGAKGDLPPPAERIESVVKTHGSADVAILKLLDEGHGYRETIRDLKAKLPPDGAVVLKGDDAKLWAKYQELGDPGEIRKSLDGGKAAIGELDGLKWERHLGEVARVAGYQAKVLAPLLKQLPEGATAEIGEAKGRDGKAVPTPFVVEPAKDGKGEPKRTPLAEYAQAAWPEFLPALKPAQANPAIGTPPARGAVASNGSLHPNPTQHDPADDLPRLPRI